MNGLEMRTEETDPISAILQIDTYKFNKAETFAKLRKSRLINIDELALF